jgi:hypothetical protein
MPGKLKVSFLLIAIVISASILAAVPSGRNITPAFHSVQTTTVLRGHALEIARMKWYCSLSIADYAQLQGKKLNYFQRLSFHLSQNRMKSMLKNYDYGETSTLQKISWLLKGLLLGPIALLIAYLFVGEDDRELIKWVWFGFAGWVVWVGVVIFLVLH